MTNTKPIKPNRKRKPKGNYRTSRMIREKIVLHMLAAEHDLPALAEAAGLTLPELVEWARLPEHAQLLRALSDLSDTSCQMLINRYRAAAAGRLFELSGKHGEKALETARKACVDLLRSNLQPPMNADRARTSTPAEQGKYAKPPSEAAILEALEKLGGDA